MTIVIGLVKYNNLRSSPLMEIFYRDGLIYFVILTGRCPEKSIEVLCIADSLAFF